MNERAIVIRERPVYLDAEDIALTPISRARLFVRAVAKRIGWTLVPFIIAQALAFGSFIYEEALQGAGFGVRGALMAQDAYFALDAVRRFETLMRNAQWYHDTFGRMAFWTAPAFRDYFYLTAPTQLAGFYNDGKRLGLWGEDVRRWAQITKEGKEYSLDTWMLSPIDKLRAYGFDPELINNPDRCAKCREEELLARKPKGSTLSDPGEQHDCQQEAVREVPSHQNRGEMVADHAESRGSHHRRQDASRSRE